MLRLPCTTVIVLFLSLATPGFAATELPPFPSLTSEDRVLIIAPHPDDEVIGAGGIIQEAVRLKCPLRIVYLTNGDNNELAFLYYKKRPVLTREGFKSMGIVRRQESVDAMASLGVTRDQLVFLGFPDLRLMTLWTEYWSGPKPLRGLFARFTHVPYEDALSPGAAYTADNLLSDLHRIYHEFRPTRIFAGHPADNNQDHRASYLFMKLILLTEEDKSVRLHPYLIHAHRYPRPAGLHADRPALLPRAMREAGIEWSAYVLSPEQIEGKRKAIGFFRTQTAYKPRFLVSFVRTSEPFGDFPELYANFGAGRETVEYNLKDGVLSIRLHLRHVPETASALDFYLFGYSKTVDFALMPKLRIHVTGRQTFAVYEGKRGLTSTGVGVEFRGKTMTVSVPAALLKGPDRIFTAIRSRLVRLPVAANAWRVLKLPEIDRRR